MNARIYQKFIDGKLDEEGLMLALYKYRRSRNTSRAKIRKKVNPYFSLDDKVYIHKYYPWCYENYQPSLVLQGWYNESKAKKAYLRVYGPNSLKYVKFIKGKEALEQGFHITYHLYINGGWRPIYGKHTMYHCSGEGLGLYTKNKLVVSMPGATGHLKRKKLEDEIQYFNNGTNGETIFKDTSIKKVRLQATQAAKNRGKKDLYEDETPDGSEMPGPEI